MKNQVYLVPFDGKGHEYSGLERVILTSDGNLQRTLSAYYNSTVRLEILKFEKCGTNAFTREIILSCLGKVFCNARSHLSVTDPEVLDLLVEKKYGFGQLFAYLGRIPVFVPCQNCSFLSSFQNLITLSNNFETF
eukprot:TRINITY_DN3108_c0_g1_i18.p1 TRINITY_DN3108_c0_g1~~TRINITY_DN3108_c0_g1_i18.p1  ORF type:complete len:135 (+),score=19.13 TRINITY_DN3108_c0_g1_i18:199-603(+)